MYTGPVSLMLGFHGCDKEVGERVLQGGIRHLHKSENEYDWLGHGIYFWENNPERARQFAEERKGFPRSGKKPITTPFVIGAVIDPGNCLNLLESNSLRLLEDVYQFLREAHETARIPMPENKVDAKTHELLRRNLDCAVIESLHTSNKERGVREYDTVRGVFVEGSCLYPNSGFHKRNHIQICVRNAQCIMGYFRLLTEG
jgi:hypothetical protein